MQFEKVAYIEAESRMVIPRGGEVGEMGTCWLTGTKLHLSRMYKFLRLVYIVNDTILHAESLLRE